MEKLLKDLLAYIQAADAPQAIRASADANEAIRKTLVTFKTQIAETAATIECDRLPVVDVHEVHPPDAASAKFNRKCVEIQERRRASNWYPRGAGRADVEVLR